MQIKATHIWPGMILTDHQHRGRVADVTSRGMTPWGTERVAVWFHDAFEPLLLESPDTVSVVVEG